jgi:hypothetical protein
LNQDYTAGRNGKKEINFLVQASALCSMSNTCCVRLGKINMAFKRLNVSWSKYQIQGKERYAAQNPIHRLLHNRKLFIPVGGKHKNRGKGFGPINSSRRKYARSHYQ